jgi:hypothetical protein
LDTGKVAVGVCGIDVEVYTGDFVGDGPRGKGVRVAVGEVCTRVVVDNGVPVGKGVREGNEVAIGSGVPEADPAQPTRTTNAKTNTASSHRIEDITIVNSYVFNVFTAKKIIARAS